jgi:hypothetical protein
MATTLARMGIRKVGADRRFIGPLARHWRHVVAVAHDLSLRLLTPDQAPATRVWLHFPVERCLLLPDTP